jgi:hypothetical protein
LQFYARNHGIFLHAPYFKGLKDQFASLWLKEPRHGLLLELSLLFASIWLTEIRRCLLLWMIMSRNLEKQ